MESALDQVLSDLLFVLAVFQEISVEQVKQRFAPPIDIIDILNGFVPPLGLLVVSAQTSVDSFDLGVRALEYPHSIAGVEVLGLLHLSEVEVAIRHLFVNHQLSLLVSRSYAMLEA